MSALRRRIARLDRARIDTVAAAGIVLALELELRNQGSHRLVTTVAAALFAAPIAVRRRWPGGALIVCSAVAVIQAALGGQLAAANGIVLPPIVLAYAAGAWLDLRRSRAALAVAALAFAGLVLSTPTPHSVSDSAAGVFLVAMLYVVPWFVGRIAREPIRRAAAFRELAAQAAAEVEAREQAAIAAERVRIGHELQDIIAHSVSAMVVQAGGARQLLRSEPERARDSILAVEHTGREALADLRRLLGMLRKDDDPRALTPQPGLDELGSLLAAWRTAGLRCDLRREGAPIALTPGIDLVGYRVIEAVLREAAESGVTSAAVTVRHRSDRLELEVSGDVSIPDLERQLEGIAERIALYDGSLRRLPVGDTGFTLQAVLPLGATGMA